MSTHQSTRHLHRLRTRLAAGLLALSAALAIGTSILLIALIGAGHTTISTPTTTASELSSAPPAITTSPPGCFRDPGTHALLRTHTTGNHAAEGQGEDQGRIVR
jgi:hypothetical protein